MLDRERDQLRPIVDLTRGQSARRPRAVRREQENDASISPRGVFEREFESLDIRLLRATFVLLDAFLSSMSHHQVLCLVLHACCLFCLHVLYKAYFGSDPLETFSRGSLVKNRLRFVNKNQCSVYCLCCDP